MSDPKPTPDTAPLPASAFEITVYRQAVDAASVSKQSWSARVWGRVFLIATALWIAVLLFAAWGADGRGNDVAGFIVGGVVGIGVLLALLVVLPIQLARRHRDRAVDAALASLEKAAQGLMRHMASIGYSVSLDSAIEWLRVPDPDVTVPLVHDSTIAARWWRPAENDQRIFVEPFLQQHGEESALPILTPINLPIGGPAVR